MLTTLVQMALLACCAGPVLFLLPLLLYRGGNFAVLAFEEDERELLLASSTARYLLRCLAPRPFHPALPAQPLSQMSDPDVIYRAQEPQPAVVWADFCRVVEAGLSEEEATPRSSPRPLLRRLSLAIDHFLLDCAAHWTLLSLRLGYLFFSPATRPALPAAGPDHSFLPGKQPFVGAYTICARDPEASCYLLVPHMAAWTLRPLHPSPTCER